MKGDFSRVRFNAANRFSRVLQQQGRVTLDADGNEQTEILLHYLRTLARDLIGDYGGPIESGFSLELVDDKLLIGAGHYYVHGILCESDGCDYAEQPDYAPPAPDASGEGGDPLLAFLRSNTPNDDRFWIYLDVWERHVTFVEEPSLREVALGGPDTCTRSKVVWQVKARAVEEISGALDAKQKALAKRIKQLKDSGGDPATIAALEAKSARIAAALAQLKDDPGNACAAPLEDYDDSDGRMAARLEKSAQPKTPCIIAPDARYRGAENQLYRVEIHAGGAAGVATFKWSRDNGSVLTSWLGTTGAGDLRVAEARGFVSGAWVELSDDARDLRGEPGVLVRISKVDGDVLTVDAASRTAAASIACNPALHSKARCWDQTGDALDGGVPLLAANPAAWIDLEDGIEVRFAADGTYRSGDYWLIPARVAGGADGGIDWEDGAEQPPRSAEHHYAPLGFVAWSSQDRRDAAIEATSCLCTLRPLTPCQVVRARGVVPADASVPQRTGASSTKKPKPKPKKHG
jgi:hypothetical protein